MEKTEHPEEPHPLIVRALLVVLSVALLWLALPPVGLAPLALVAMAPFLASLRGLSKREGLRVGIAFGFLSAAANAHWFLYVFPWFFCIALWAIIALFPAIYGVIHAGLARKSAALLVVGAPAAWVALDWFRSEAWHLKFAWFTLGHALAGNQVLRQNADIAGVYGLTLFAFATSFALERAFALRKEGGKTFVIGLVLLGANGAFAARGNRVLGFIPKTETRSLSVLAVQDENFNKIEPKRSLTIAAIGTQAPDVILWPEDSFFNDYTRTPFVPHLESIARLASQAFVFGSMRDLPGDKQRNAAILLGPDGKKIGEYDKRVPVQFVESCVAGTESPVFPVASARLGVMICYDGTYPFVARDLVLAGAEVLLVPTMDVKEWGRVQHEHHALFYPLRACELRRPIVRAASSGVTLAVDAWGRTVKRIEPFDSATMTAVIHPNDSRTPYAKGGWLLPFFACGVALLGIAGAVLKR